ncbi:hypothetical protein IV203_015280 [Nitzschia inconspicua]|uniref:Uncharacterized protein n=1 Tax=Nitzschia inconspicua TaxID=303405 RepID=A0A9K3P8T5_9STRA|nr:hypothetical protein IV203_020235 [Nitzschia inconspicua]KAG7358691.1 hypothetical protein IV203_015280 [Nitzschia inconspicua]
MQFSTILLVMLASAAYVSSKTVGTRRLQGGNGGGTGNDEKEEACINDQIVFDLVSVEDGEEAGYLNYTYKFNNTGASNISHWSVIVGDGCTIKDHVCINKKQAMIWVIQPVKNAYQTAGKEKKRSTHNVILMVN